MDGEASIDDLDALLLSIKSSEAVERRNELLSKLVQLHLPQKVNLAPLIEYLTIFWEDFTCLDVSQCMLNRTIVHVAAQYVDSHLCGCSSQFLVLGTKASTWCGKHLKMTLMSMEEFQEEEHCNFFIQLLLDLLSFSAATIMAITGFPVSSDMDLAVHIEGFVMAQLKLIQDIVTDIKRINLCRIDVLKCVQTVIDGVVRLCTEYYHAVNGDFNDSRSVDGSNGGSGQVNLVHPVVSIMEYTIEKLCDLGAIAASDGGNLVSILNVSWRGVLALLHSGKQQLRKRVSVKNILEVLISLVKQPLKSAAETWSSSPNDSVSAPDARRIFLPVKFYLLNAVKLTSLFPPEAYLARNDIALCILLTSSFGILSGLEDRLRSAAEAFSELVEKLSVDLAASMLNSGEVTDQLKSEFLDSLFAEEFTSSPSSPDSALSDSSGISMVVPMFSVAASDVCGSGTRALLLGRVALFAALLRFSASLVETVRTKLTRKLGWLMDVLVDREMYPFVLTLQIPVLYSSGNTPGLVWQPMLSVILHALKTCMIVAHPTSWAEMEAFLLENAFHPHFLCAEIVTELWCFLARNAEKEAVSHVTDKLLSLANPLASTELVALATPRTPLRRTARLICSLLVNATPSIVDHAFGSVDDVASTSAPVLRAALLSEGFPLGLLSGTTRSAAKRKIIADSFAFIESFTTNSRADHNLRTFRVEFFALSSSLPSWEDCMPEVDRTILEFLVSVVRSLSSRPESATKERDLGLLTEALGVVSSMKGLYERDEMAEAVAELHGLFVKGPTQGAMDAAALHLCKPYLAVFMGGLGGMEMSEKGDCAKSAGALELFHMLFRERHWALVHLALGSFGYFAARTCCNRLWKFIPQDAALSFDLASGSEAEVERFMAELKAFLEKETALLSVTHSAEEFELLVKEGSVLAKMKRRSLVECGNQANKRRRLPPAIGRGVQMLEGGLGAFRDGLSQGREGLFWPPELHRKLLDQFSLLEDVFSHLTGLVTFL